MREQLDLIVSVKFHIGITPAHAGTTNSFNCVTLTCQDHPRSCGNNYPAVLLAFYQNGITLAHAGTTIRLFFSVLSNGITLLMWNNFMAKLIRPFHEDHPRSCGNNLTFSVCLIASLGSPPPCGTTINSGHHLGQSDHPAHAEQLKRRCTDIRRSPSLMRNNAGEEGATTLAQRITPPAEQLMPMAP